MASCAGCAVWSTALVWPLPFMQTWSEDLGAVISPAPLGALSKGRGKCTVCYLATGGMRNEYSFEHNVWTQWFGLNILQQCCSIWLLKFPMCNLQFVDFDFLYDVLSAHVVDAKGEDFSKPRLISTCMETENSHGHDRVLVPLVFLPGFLLKYVLCNCMLHVPISPSNSSKFCAGSSPSKTWFHTPACSSRASLLHKRSSGWVISQGMCSSWPASWPNQWLQVRQSSCSLLCS